jgi:hypothetical protein
MFFVATAPADPNTHVNVSPRGLDTFRVLDRNRVTWLDLTGSRAQGRGGDGRFPEALQRGEHGRPARPPGAGPNERVEKR